MIIYDIAGDDVVRGIQNPKIKDMEKLRLTSSTWGMKRVVSWGSPL
jgi:hypothetical protein